MTRNRGAHSGIYSRAAIVVEELSAQGQLDAICELNEPPLEIAETKTLKEDVSLEEKTAVERLSERSRILAKEALTLSIKETFHKFVACEKDVTNLDTRKMLSSLIELLAAYVGMSQFEDSVIYTAILASMEEIVASAKLAIEKQKESDNKLV